MRYLNKVALLLCLVVSPSAFAAATVTVKVVNLSGEAITLSPLSVNDRNTLIKANTPPAHQLLNGRSTVFAVASSVKDGNFASVRYGNHTKACSFLTTHLNIRQSNGVYGPRWMHNAKPFGGANCTSRLMSTNPLSRDWMVEFTVR